MSTFGIHPVSAIQCIIFFHLFFSIQLKVLYAGKKNKNANLGGGATPLVRSPEKLLEKENVEIDYPKF